MSAGPKAKPIGKEGWENSDGNPTTDLPAFTCQEESCGYKGTADELLVEDDDDNMYCPVCGLMYWIWD